MESRDERIFQRRQLLGLYRPLADLRAPPRRRRATISSYIWCIPLAPRTPRTLLLVASPGTAASGPRACLASLVPRHCV